MVTGIGNSLVTVENAWFLCSLLLDYCITGIFRKRAISGKAAFLVIFRRCRILTISNKSKFSRKANAKVLSTSTQFPQLVCLQNSTIITSTKTCHAVTTGQGTSTWLLFRETNGLKVFRKNFGRG